MACKFIFFTTTNGKTYLLAILISYLRVRFKVKRSKLVFNTVVSICCALIDICHNTIYGVSID